MTICQFTAVPALTLLFCFSSCSSAKTPTIEISVAQLIADYEKNEPAAGNLYEGKRLNISGEVTNIATIRDTIGVSLKIDDSRSHWSVICLINKSDEQNTYSKSKIGIVATFVGTVRRVEDKKFVQLTNCQFSE